MIPAVSRVAVESESLLAATSAAAVAGIVGVVAFAGKNLPLWGGVSLGIAVAGAVLVLGASAGYVGYWRSRDLPDQAWRRELATWKSLVDASTVALVHALIAGIAAVAAFLLLQRSFQGLKVDVYTSVAALALASALAVYWIYLSVCDITTRKLSGLLVLFMAMSTLASMATAQDPNWWEYHFSQLGTLNGISRGLFNLSLIIAGFFVTTFALYLDRDLRALTSGGVLLRPWSARYYSAAFVVMGLMLAGVGVFPLHVSVLLHNLCAAGMSVAFALLLLSSPVVLRGLPRRFFIICGAFFTGLILAFLLFEPIGYYNLTAFELVAFVIIFGWIAVFIRLLDALAAETASLAPVLDAVSEHA